MKQFTFLVFLLISIFLQGQVSPDFINYQFVIRDANGTPLAPNTNATINIKLFNTFTASLVTYEENHSITVPQTAVVNIRVGKGIQVGANTFSGVDWSTKDVSYEIAIDGNSIGSRQTFAAVPYSYYSIQSGGGSMPNGTAPNQTLYWDDVAKLWKVSSNLSHDDNRVSIGNTLINPRNKLHVSSSDINDTSTVYAVKTNAVGRHAAFRGTVLGASNSSSVSTIGTAIYGGDFTSYNTGSGLSIGASGTALSNNGTGAGVLGIAGGQSTATLIGVYGSVETNSPGIAHYAGFFNHGNVMIGDTLIFQNESSSSVGHVLTLNSDKRAVWQSPATSGPSWNINGNNGINPSNNYLGTNDNNPVIFKTNSTARMVIQNTGEVGIDVATPINPLSVFGDSTRATILAVNNYAVLSNSLASGIYARANNPHPLSAAIRAEHTGGGTAILASTGANTAVVLAANQNSTGGNAHGVYGVSNSSANSAAGLYGESKGNGHGVIGLNTNPLATNANGIYGVADFSNSNSAVRGDAYGGAVGVMGMQSHTNAAVVGVKPASAIMGSAGKFDIANTSNPDPAMHAFTTGSGPAVKASTGTITTSALSLLLEGGHIQAVGPAVSISHNVTGNFAPLTSVGCGNCNDVRGKISFNVSFNPSVNPGDSFTINFTFAKAYLNPPTVVVVPNSNPDKLDYFVNNITNTGFSVTYINNGAIITSLPTNYRFNYFVIE